MVYLAGFVVGIGGIGLIQSILGAPDHLSTVSANSMLLAFGAILWLMAVVGDAAHGVLMFPVLKPHNERIAVGYLAFRIMDAVFIAIMVLFVLLQIPLGSEYLKAASPRHVLPSSPEHCVRAGAAVCLRDRHDHAWDIWFDAVLHVVQGKVGSALAGRLGPALDTRSFCAGWCRQSWGPVWVGLSSIPGGLWEVFMGVWLIVKGFNASAFVSQAYKNQHPGRTTCTIAGSSTFVNSAQDNVGHKLDSGWGLGERGAAWTSAAPPPQAIEIDTLPLIATQNGSNKEG